MKLWGWNFTCLSSAISGWPPRPLRSCLNKLKLFLIKVISCKMLFVLWFVKWKSSGMKLLLFYQAWKKTEITEIHFISLWYRPNTRIFLHSKIQPSSFKTVDWKWLSDFVICKMIVIWHEMTFVLLSVKKCFRSLLEFNVTFHQQKSKDKTL